MESEEQFVRRPLVGILFSALPIVSIAIVGTAYATLFWAGAEGRPADGALTRVRFAACPEAQPVLAGRVEDMGLGEVTWAHEGAEIVLQARFPSDPAVAQGIPTTLSRPGVLVVHDGEDPTRVIATNADVESASPYLGFRAAPTTLIQLQREPGKRLKQYMEENFKSHLVMKMDGEVLLRRKNMPSEPLGQLMVEAEASTDPRVVTLAAERAVVLNHGPLPCPVSVLSAEPVAPTTPGS